MFNKNRMDLRGHQFRLGAIGADDVFFLVGDKAASDERGLAETADEAIVVPVAVLE